MKSVRIPAKVARDLRDMLERSALSEDIGDHFDAAEALRFVDCVNVQLEPKKFVVARRKRVKAKKATKREETASIREAVFYRAAGVCEMLCGAPATDLEHAFGRVRVKQAASNCLALCRDCHVRRTRNSPSAKYWWGRYVLHFERHGYAEEQRMAAALYNKRAE